MLQRLGEIFKIMGELLAKGFDILKKVTAPILGIPIAVTVSTLFFVAYLGMEVINLGEAELRRRILGAKQIYYNPTLKAMSDALFGVVKGVWTDYALKPYTESLHKYVFKRLEESFAEKGVEHTSVVTTGVENRLEKDEAPVVATQELRKFAHKTTNDLKDFGLTVDDKNPVFPKAKRVKVPNAVALTAEKKGHSPSAPAA